MDLDFLLLKPKKHQIFKTNDNSYLKKMNCFLITVYRNFMKCIYIVIIYKVKLLLHYVIKTKAARYGLPFIISSKIDY